MQYQMAGEELQLIRGRLPHFFRSFSLQEEAQMLQTCFTIMQYPIAVARVSSAATPAVPRASRATTAAAHGPHWWEGVGGQNVWGWGHTVGCLSTWGGRAAPTHHSSPPICSTTSRMWGHPTICSRVS